MPYEKLVVSDRRFRQTCRLLSAPVQRVIRNPLELEQCLANSPPELDYCPSQLTSGHGPVFGQLNSTWTSVRPTHIYLDQCLVNSTWTSVRSTQLYLDQCSANTHLPGPVFGQLNSTWTSVRSTQLYLDQCSANTHLPGLLSGPTNQRTSKCLR